MVQGVGPAHAERLVHLALVEVDAEVGFLVGDAGRHDGAEDVRALPGQRAQGRHGAGAGGGRVADRRGAEAGQRLGRPHVVGTAEEGEDALVVGGGDRRRLGVLGQLAGEDRGDGGLGDGSHGGGVAIPGRLGCEVGEGREAGGVDGAVTVEERQQGQLVEDDQDDRRRGPHLHIGRLDPAADDEIAHGRGEEEESQEDRQGQRQVAEHRPQRPGAEREDGGPDRDGDADQQEAGTGVTPERRLGRGRDEHAGAHAEQAGVDPVPKAPAAQPERLLDQPQAEGRAHADEEGVGHDQARARAAGDEGVGGVADHVEDGLGDHDRRQADELGEVRPLPGGGRRTVRLGGIPR